MFGLNRLIVTTIIIIRTSTRNKNSLTAGFSSHPVYIN